MIKDATKLTGERDVSKVQSAQSAVTENKEALKYD